MRPILPARILKRLFAYNTRDDAAVYYLAVGSILRNHTPVVEIGEMIERPPEHVQSVVASV